MEQQIKRSPGRRRTGRKDRLDVSVSKDLPLFIDWLIGEQGNRSAFFESD